MINIINNPYRRPTDSVSPKRTGSDAPLQPMTAAAQRVKAARDRRHRYERRARGSAKKLLMDRRLGADRRDRPKIDISI
jgi:hypothetical protein